MIIRGLFCTKPPKSLTFIAEKKSFLQEGDIHLKSANKLNESNKTNMELVCTNEKIVHTNNEEAN